MWTAALLALFAVALAVWASFHGFAAMWIEGFAEYEQQVLVLWQVEGVNAVCALQTGSRSWPLAMSAYTGPANIYLNFPAAAVYLLGWTDDPFVYRFTGFAVMLGIAWLFYLCCRLFYPARSAFFATAILLLSPVQFLLALVDLQSFLTGTLAAMATAYFVLRFWKFGRAVEFVIACACAGACLLTRTEALVWPVAGAAAFVVLHADARRVLFARLLAVWRYWWVGAAAGVAAALPVILFNIRCPEFGIFAFLLDRPNQLQFGLMEGLLIRAHEFVELNLAHRWSFFEIWTPNYLFLLAFAVSLGLVLADIWQQRRPNLPLTLLLAGLGLSLVVTQGLRDQHLFLLQPVVTAVVLCGAHASAFRSAARLLARFGLPAVALASGLTTTADLAAWRTVRLEPTMLSHSDAPALSAALSALPGEPRFYFTNIGLRGYVEYVSRGQVQGREITVWSDADRGREEVLEALAVTDRPRVFVAVPEEKECEPIQCRRWHGFVNVPDDRICAASHVRRTALLVQALQDEQVTYEVARVGADGGYELYIVPAGVGPAP